MQTPPFRLRWLSIATLGAALAMASQTAGTATQAQKQASAQAGDTVTVATCVAPALPVQYQSIQKVYLAFYLRPGDPAGLRYWAGEAGNDIAAILPTFGRSDEARRLYGDITADTVGDAIDKIYQALFGKQPDAAGKQFYIDGFKAGRFSAADLAYRILQGAQNDDQRAIDNKLAAANFFSRMVDADLDGQNQQVTYDQKDEFLVREWMRLINAHTVPTPESVRTFMRDNVAAASDALRQPQPSPKLDSLWPASATVGQSTSFVLQGQNLPSTARLSPGNAECEAPEQVQCDGSGFVQRCKLNGASGQRSVTLQTAAGGQTIATQAIQAEASPSAPPSSNPTPPTPPTPPAPPPPPNPPEPPKPPAPPNSPAPPVPPAQPVPPSKPQVTSVSPTQAPLNQTTNFTVYGANLPATATLGMADAWCDAPTNVQASGFQQRCTIHGHAGNRPVRVLSAEAGVPIGGTYTLEVMPPQPKITSISPWSAELGFFTHFRISGENLPATATLSIAGARCDAPFEVKVDGGGFEQICEFEGYKGQVGDRTMQVLAAKTGQPIGDAYTLTVVARSPDVYPNYAELGKSNEFIVRTYPGGYLPSTATLSIADAQCDAPVEWSPWGWGLDEKGFKQHCNVWGKKGQRSVHILNSEEGNPVGEPYTIKVIEPMPAPHSMTKLTLTNTGVNDQQCYWTDNDSLAACNSPEALALSGPGKQDGMRTQNQMRYAFVPKPGGGHYDKTECVKDEITGLIWEGKVNASGHLRHYEKLYTYLDPDSPNDASLYVQKINEMGLCGFHDWRLPMVDELQSLVDYGKSWSGPSINTEWFPHTLLGLSFMSYVIGGYWTAETVSDSPMSAWIVEFNRGGIDKNFRDGNYAVRLVRAEP